MLKKNEKNGNGKDSENQEAQEEPKRRRTRTARTPVQPTNINLLALQEFSQTCREVMGSIERLVKLGEKIAVQGGTSRPLASNAQMAPRPRGRSKRSKNRPKEFLTHLKERKSFEKNLRQNLVLPVRGRIPEEKKESYQAQILKWEKAHPMPVAS